MHLHSQIDLLNHPIDSDKMQEQYAMVMKDITAI
jgi:hypothetical protein